MSTNTQRSILYEIFKKGSNKRLVQSLTSGPHSSLHLNSACWVDQAQPLEKHFHIASGLNIDLAEGWISPLCSWLEACSWKHKEMRSLNWSWRSRALAQNQNQTPNLKPQRRIGFGMMQWRGYRWVVEGKSRQRPRLYRRCCKLQVLSASSWHCFCLWRKLYTEPNLPAWKTEKKFSAIHCLFPFAGNDNE